MAITVKYLEGLGVDKEVAEKIFAERSGEIEKEKAKTEKLENELKESKESLKNLTTKFETLKTANADGADWKAKFEALQADNEAKAKQAEADRIMKEKETKNREMFKNAVEAYGKTMDDWNGRFNSEGYYNEFIKAIESDENAGRAHKDVLHDLVKNDENAFKGVTVVKLAGGTARPTGKAYNSKDEIMAIKDSSERLTAIRENPHFFRKE